MMRLLMICLLLGASPLWAQGDPATAARAASARLDEAGRALDKAKSAKDRVKALSETVHAYEDGLEAMREGLRRASIREQQLSRELQARETEIAQLIGVLQAMGKSATPVLLLHPSGPTGTARSGMILAEVTPALNQQALELRGKLEEVTTLRTLQETATETLQKGLTGAQEARTELSTAIADRTDLPVRFTEDPIRTAILIASTETLDAFSSGLTDLSGDADTAAQEDISGQIGGMAWPVQGQILRQMNEVDAAGIARPGVVMATRPAALVSTPVAATIRYRGPLLDYGNVMILEPQSGILFVLAGLDTVYGQAGQVLPAGSPVGLMGGNSLGTGGNSADSGLGTGNGRPETLYIEVRQGNTPVDPATWFVSNKDN